MEKLLCFLSIMLGFGSTYAQEDLRLKESLDVSEKLSSELNRSALKDTNQVVMFAFKVKVIKQSGVYKVLSVSVSDSVAYDYYKSFDFIKKVNYKVLAGHRKKATFIIPVAILMHFPTKTNAGLESIDALGDRLGNYFYVYDEKGKLVDTSDFIYLPLGTIKTTTASDI